MKVSQVILKQIVSISQLGINGVRTLGAGNLKGKEELELDYAKQMVIVTKNGVRAQIPFSSVDAIIE